KMKYILKSIVLFLGIMSLSCEEGIDSITAVAPAADETAPQITVSYPTAGAVLQPFEEVSSLDIKFQVTDDIEILDIKVLMDGSQIAHLNSFKDYRIALEELTFNGLVNGEHTLTITATDVEGKPTTQVVTFEKSPPYSALFDGEIFYMPFNGDYMDFISFQEAGQVGSPGFAGTGFLGADAYKGGPESYLTFPMEGLKNPEFSAAFWYKINPAPGNAGILSIGDNADDRLQGLRLFREGPPEAQTIKLNVGTG